MLSFNDVFMLWHKNSNNGLIDFEIFCRNGHEPNIMEMMLELDKVYRIDQILFKSHGYKPHLFMSVTPSVGHKILLEFLKNTYKEDVEWYKKCEAEITRYEVEFKEALQTKEDKLRNS